MSDEPKPNRFVDDGQDHVIVVDLPKNTDPKNTEAWAETQRRRELVAKLCGGK